MRKEAININKLEQPSATAHRSLYFFIGFDAAKCV